uniref:Uncharacterized protein n=1 Tax=Anguilla anguilla TaxID=7936 RepID=A0A0E9Y1I7_ANGAN
MTHSIIITTTEHEKSTTIH